MRPQTILIGFLALVLSGTAAVWTQGMMNGKVAPAAETVPVVVAVVDMSRGGMVTAEMVAIKQYPKEVAPAGCLSKIEDAVDRAVAVPLTKDEPMLEYKLSPKGAGRGMASQVRKGMRACTIQTLTPASGGAGFILPENWVDVLLTFTGGDEENGGGSTMTLLQKVKILAVGERMDAPAENKMDVNQLRSVTLEVTPEQAQQLNLGQNRGTLHLSLRNPTDDARDSSNPATLKSLQYRLGKPWDVRLKSVIGELAKMRANMPAPPPEPTPVAAAPEPPPVAEVKVAEAPKQVFIRTIRGTQEGGVLVDYIPPGRAQAPR